MTGELISESTLERWRRAVLHIESAPDREAFTARDQAMQEAVQLNKNGEIDREELVTRISEIGRQQDRSAAGTAIYLKDGDDRFLVTSRRVVETSSQTRRYLRNRLLSSERLQEREGPLSSSAQREISRAKRQAERRIAGAITRIPTLDDVLEDRLHPGSGATTLTGLNVKPYEEGPFSLSAQVDLAVISLKHEDVFVRRLENLGHEPIDRDVIGDVPSRVGSPLFTVGFPFPMSLVDRRNQGASGQPATVFAEPAFTFGHASMLHDQLSYFWADVNIYPGNSGGPVVEDGKLVGIVSGQMSSPVENTASSGEAPSDRRHRMPFDRITKARYLLDLLDEQKSKES